VLLQSIYSLAAQFPPLFRGPLALRTLFFLPLLPALSLLTSACAKREAAPNPDASPTLERGDQVVVEQTAAHFFEGRVLAAELGHLRVQAADGSDSLTVAANDVYRLPPSEREILPGALAICGRAEAWLPCRVLKTVGSTLSASTAAGEPFELPRSRVVLPSPLTELNLKRYFARSEAQLEFSRSAVQAGEPRPEPGWHPALHERLLAKVGTDWFTAHVRELGDDGAVVTLSVAQRVATVPFSALAAEPPSSFANELHRGDFVLVRPETPSEPWARRQVRAANPGELKISDAEGVVKTTSPREVVPLGT
jgi:hypothetical protein